MGPNLIALAIPGFFAFIGLELLVARTQRKKVYSFSDSITDLACGVSEQTVMFFFTVTLLGCYSWCYQHGRVVTLPKGSPWEWVLAFLGVELAYYWWHRLSHEVNFLWAVHVVHHQSEELNLSVALRQAILTNFTQLPFYVPMAIVGVTPLAFVTMNSVSTLYQFFIHTEVVGKLGAGRG